MSDDSLVPLPQGAGYGVVVGVGLAFGIGMVLVNRFLEKFLRERSDHTEMLSPYLGEKLDINFEPI